MEWLYEFSEMLHTELLIAHVSSDAPSVQENNLSRRLTERILHNKVPTTHITSFQGQDIKDSLLQL